MKAQRLEKFATEFKKKFPNAWYRIGDFSGDGSIVFWTGEDCYTNDGVPLFDYWTDDYSLKTRDGCGILLELGELAEKHGLYFETYDPGTIIAYDI